VSRVRYSSDDGSIMPLILGFWMIGLMAVGAGVAASDAFTKQRDLQSMCDSASIAAAVGAASGSIHVGGAPKNAIPLSKASEALQAYFARDPNRDGVHAAAELSPDERTVTVRCEQHNQIALGALIGKRGGIDQSVYSSARTPSRD